MRLVLDTSRVGFTVTKEPMPKTEFGGTQQKVNKTTNRPEWVVEVLALDPEHGEVIRVTVTGEQPKVNQGQPVAFSELEAIPWTRDGKNGVAYRAFSIQPSSQAKAA